MATAGLFSMLGGDEAAMQRQLDEQRAAKFAEQTQEQRLAGMGYKAGAGLGRGIAGAFGVDVTDPVVRQAAEIRRLASEYDTTTAEGMAKFAQAARAINPDVAEQAAQKALVMREQGAKTRKAEMSVAQEEELRRELAALGDKATDADIMKVTIKYGSPDKVLAILQSSADKAASREQRAQLQQQHDQLLLSLKQMGLSASAGTQALQQEVLKQRLEDLQTKADEKKVAAESAVQGRIASFDTALDTLNTISSHPGKKDVVGTLSGALVSKIPGTNAAGFSSQLETFKAQTFLPQVEKLKGMGALSDAEGKKLTAAVGALDINMKPAEFDAQVNKIKADLQTAKARASSRASSTSSATPPAGKATKRYNPATGQIEQI